jgi:transposase
MEWQAHRVVCPAGHTSRDGGRVPDRHGKARLRVRFSLPVCRRWALQEQWTQTAANVLILRPDEQRETALQHTPRNSSALTTFI